jgi:phosphatidylethanolamine-binding protein (PEBP) family uncharacterized protein
MKTWNAMAFALAGICAIVCIVRAVPVASATEPAATSGPTSVSAFVLTSPRVNDGGELPVEFTGDGEAATLPLEWCGTPQGTRSFALIMHHVAPDKTKWYWMLYNIPPDVKQLPRNVKGIGTLGNNSVNGRTEYAPPHSKGPGLKTYIYTIYALSAPPRITVEPGQVSRDVLLAAMDGLVLDTAQLSVVYTRFPGPAGNAAREGKPPPPGDRP